MFFWGLAGLALAYWRQLLVFLVAFCILGVCTKAVQLPFLSHYDNEIVVTNMVVRPLDYGHQMSFSVHNNTPKQRINDMTFSCGTQTSSPFVKTVGPGETVSGTVRFYEDRPVVTSECTKSFEMMRVK